MGDEFSSCALEKVVARICGKIGFSKINTTALEVLTSIMMEYMATLSKGALRYAELAGRTEPTLWDFDLMFKDLGINIEDVKEYMDDVGEIRPPVEVPEYPIQRENHLNFLRPGSNEVIMRPLHIHEYMPPQFPELENKSDYTENKSRKRSSETLLTCSASQMSSRKLNNVMNRSTKKGRYTEGQPLREIKSILMTRSGFLSSSCEGKLPDVKLPVSTPIKTEEPVEPKVTNITSMNLLAAKGLLKKKNKSSESKVVTPPEPQKRVVENDVIRRKVLENYETIKSDSQLIDKHLKHILCMNTKLRCNKVPNTSKSNEELHAPAGYSSSKATKLLETHHSRSNSTIINEEATYKNTDYSKHYK